MLCNRTLSAVLMLSLVPLLSQAAAAKTYRQVDFRSADTPPTPLQLKRAEVQDGLLGRPGDTLTGFLRVPDGDGPFPAAILLHGCEGIKAFQQDWAAYLTAQGYVTLLVDSFSARGQTAPICDKVSTEKRSKLVSGRVFDAFGALDYLAEQPFVAPDRIAGLAWTRESGISLTNDDSVSQFFDRKFAASVQFYPECRSTKPGGEFHAPLLLLLPGENDWAVSGDCTGLAENSSGVKPVVKRLEGARYGFDDPAFQPETVMPEWENIYKTPPKGVTVAYSQPAAEAARDDVVEFLADSLRE